LINYMNTSSKENIVINYLQEDKTMEYEEEKGFHPIYILAALYTVSVYLFPVIFFKVNGNINDEYGLYTWPLLIPLVFGLINLAVVILGKNSIGRTRLLNCAILIKYTLIPFYIIGGICVAVALLLMFTPIVIMVFVGPTIAVFFSVLGWLAMVGTAPYSVAYIAESNKQGIHGKNISVIAGVFQFIFMIDVISLMLLTLKEKKCVKITVALLIVLSLAVLISGIWLTASIVGVLIS